MGTFTKKIQRHDRLSINQPPRMGPAATAMAEKDDQVPMAAPRLPGEKLAFIRARLPGVRSAPPTPCRARAAMSCRTLGAKPHHMEATVKTTTPAMNTRLRPR